MTSGPESAQPTDPSGSPPTGEPVFLAVGKLRRPHGVRGEIQMDVLTDFPERLNPGVTLFVGPENRPQRLRSRRWHGQALLVAFEGCDTPEEAGLLRNMLVSVPADDRPALPEGEYYHHQILGLRAVTEEGRFLGTIIEILETGANEVYVLRPENGPEILLPGIAEVILSIDLEQNEMRVKPLPGLLADEEEAE